MDNKFYKAVCFLDREIRNVLLKIEKNIAENVSEIRLRCERPVALTLFDGRSVYLKENGTVTERPFENTFVCSFLCLEKCFLSLCNFSVYSHTRKSGEGFIPLKGGHGAGIAGKVVCNGETVRTITDISSINLRVAHEIKGAAMCISDVFSAWEAFLSRGRPFAEKPPCSETQSDLYPTGASADRKGCFLWTKGEKYRRCIRGEHTVMWALTPTYFLGRRKICVKWEYGPFHPNT